jgi:large conductance mechanosensitive channel
MSDSFVIYFRKHYHFKESSLYTGEHSFSGGRYLLMAGEEKKAVEKKGPVAEFMDFLMKYQVIGLAVAFIIGAAASKMVTAAVTDIIMPIVAVLIPGGDWRTQVVNVGPIKFLVGDFVGALIDFLIIALVVFIIVKFMMKEDATAKR